MTASSSQKKFSAAIRKGDIVAVRTALSTGVDPGREIEVDGFRDLPLQYAVEQKQARVVQISGSRLCAPTIVAQNWRIYAATSESQLSPDRAR